MSRVPHPIVALVVAMLGAACSSEPAPDASVEVGSDGGRTDAGGDAADGGADASVDAIRVIAVEASGHDGNPPEASVDEDFETRWSAEGDGEWIAYTLSDQTEVSYVQIAFHRGDERRFTFDVQVSMDASSWVDALTGEQSSGEGTGLETFSFSPVPARYVRLVGHGNDLSGSEGWNSYLEARVEDFPIDIACVPNDNACGSDGCGGQHPECPAEMACVSGSCQASTDDFVVLFSNDFDASPVGSYSRATWSAEWGIPVGAWSDPCRDDCANEASWAEAGLSIEEEGGNRFLRHVHSSKGTSPGTSGATWWKDIGDHEEVYLSFRVRFSGVDWMGPSYEGKLPGLCGGGSCPGGGNPPLDYEGFSTRYMFHNTEALFFYLYYAGMDTSSSNYGNSLFFSPYANAPDEWRTVTQRVVVNTPGVANGIVEGFLDGVLVAQQTDMDFRNSTDQLISTLVFATFLGGSGEDPASHGDTPTNDFDDVIVYRYGDGVPGIRRGLEPNDPGATIPLPTL